MFTLGLDGLDITINTDVKLEQNHYTFKNQAGKELGNLAAVKNGYKLHLCLPKMIRNNNSIPFGVSDYKQLKNVLEFIKNNVLNLFKGKSTKITIQACEVNSTVVLSRKEQKLFNPSHKKILSQKIKKPEQIEHEKVIAPMLEQKRQELSRTYMDSFMLRQALQRVTLIDGEKIETDKKIMTPKLQEGENLFD